MVLDERGIDNLMRERTKEDEDKKTYLDERGIDYLMSKRTKQEDDTKTYSDDGGRCCNVHISPTPRSEA